MVDPIKRRVDLPRETMAIRKAEKAEPKSSKPNTVTTKGSDSSRPESTQQTLLPPPPKPKTTIPVEEVKGPLFKKDEYDLTKDPLITNPGPKDEDFAKKLAADQKQYIGQEVRLDRSRALQKVNAQIDRTVAHDTDEQMKRLVTALWENDDKVGNKEARMFRLDEILGVLENINQTAEVDSTKNKELREGFFKHMANYINENFKEDKQDVINTLLKVYDNVKWTDQWQYLGEFVKDLGIGVAKNSGFTDKKNVAFANYNSSLFDSGTKHLALIKDLKGEFKYVKYGPISLPTIVAKPDGPGRPEALKPGSPGVIKSTKPGGFAGPTGTEALKTKKVRIKIDLSKIKKHKKYADIKKFVLPTFNNGKEIKTEQEELIAWGKYGLIIAGITADISKNVEVQKLDANYRNNATEQGSKVLEEDPGHFKNIFQVLGLNENSSDADLQKAANKILSKTNADKNRVGLNKPYLALLSIQQGVFSAVIVEDESSKPSDTKSSPTELGRG